MVTDSRKIRNSGKVIPWKLKITTWRLHKRKIFRRDEESTRWSCARKSNMLPTTQPTIPTASRTLRPHDLCTFRLKFCKWANWRHILLIIKNMRRTHVRIPVRFSPFGTCSFLILTRLGLCRHTVSYKSIQRFSICYTPADRRTQTPRNIRGATFS
jgi:hypothetical protein